MGQVWWIMVRPESSLNRDNLGETKAQELFDNKSFFNNRKYRILFLLGLIGFVSGFLLEIF